MRKLVSLVAIICLLSTNELWFVQSMDFDDEDTEKDDIEFAKMKEFFDLQSNVHDKLWAGLETLRESNNFHLTTLNEVKQEFNDFMEKQSSSSINELYVNLKDDYNQLKVECESRKADLAKLQETSAKDLEALKFRHTAELEQLKEDHRKEIASYERKIEAALLDIEAKDVEVNRIHAEAAFNFDEMQSELQNRLLDLNKKLREANNSNNVLRSQMMSFKAQYSNGIHSAEKSSNDRIKQLEDKLLVSENQLRIAQEKLFERNYVPKFTKYSINSARNAASDVPVNTETINSEKEVYVAEDKGADVAKGFWSNKDNKSGVLQVKQVTTVTSNLGESTGLKKRRKLFNLDSTDYLNNINFERD